MPTYKQNLDKITKKPKIAIATNPEELHINKVHKNLKLATKVVIKKPMIGLTYGI